MSKATTGLIHAGEVLQKAVSCVLLRIELSGIDDCDDLPKRLVHLRECHKAYSEAREDYDTQEQ